MEKTKLDEYYEQARAERVSMEERKSDIVLDRYIEETKEDLPYMEETDRKRVGALFDLIFSIRENLIKLSKERWDGKD